MKMSFQNINFTFKLLIVLVIQLTILPSLLIGSSSNEEYIEFQKKEINILKQNLGKYNSNDTLYFSILKNITNKYEYLDLDSSLLYANLYLDKAIKVKSERYKIDGLFLVGIAQQGKYNDSLAIINFHKALKIAYKNKNYKYISSIYLSLSVSYQNINQFNQAFEVLQKSLVYAKKIKEYGLISGILNNYGALNVDLLKYDEAIENFFESLIYLKKSNNKKEISATYSNIGLAYKLLDDKTKSIEFLKKSYEYEKELSKNLKNNRSHIAGVNLNIVEFHIGNAYYEFKNYDSAIYYLNNSITGNLELKDYEMVLYSAIVLAYINLESNNFNNVLKYLDLIKKYEDKINNLSLLLSIKNVQASFLNKNKKYKEALELVEFALNKNNDILFNKNVLDLVLNGIIALENLNKETKLIKYLKLKNNISDSLLRLKLINKSEILKSKYEYNNKINKRYEEIKIKRITQEKDLKFKSLLLYSFTGFSLSLIVLGLMLYKNLQKTKKINIELELNKIELEKTNQEIIENNSLINKQKDELFNINKALDKYINILSHDFRSPLSGIMMSLNNIIYYKEKFEKEQILLKIEKISVSLQNSYNLIEELLNFSTQLNVRDYNPQPILLNQIIEKNINLFQENLSNKEIDLQLLTNKNLIVFVDNKLIESVFRNLISNAIKFTPKNGSIKITTQDYESNTSLIILEDSGIGMTQLQLDSIFNIDKVLSTDGTDGEKGFGLGMTIVKENIEKHNCKIWVESELNIGTKFYFTLPNNINNSTKN